MSMTASTVSVDLDDEATEDCGPQLIQKLEVST